MLNTDSSALYYMWVANHSNSSATAVTNTVSKFDTRTGKEIARYYSVVPRNPDGTANSLRYNVNNKPSRTALDTAGDVWIANRAETTGVKGSVTKIANNLADCVDRDGNGVIHTSRDVDGNGLIDVTNPNEFVVPTDPADPKTYDECVLFSQELGSDTTGAVKGRALAVSKVSGFETASTGEVWAGHYGEKRVYKFDAATGAPLSVTGVAGGPTYLSLGFGAYGAAVDGEQRLWLLQAPGDVTTSPGSFKLAMVDTRTGDKCEALGPAGLENANSFPAKVSGYGIAIDSKNRVWVAGWSTTNRLYRYDHGTGTSCTRGTWTAFDISAARSQPVGSPAAPVAFGIGRGIAADNQGYIWMSGGRGVSPARAQLIAIAADSVGGTNVTYKMFSLPGLASPVHFVDYSDAQTGDSIGVGLDGDNNVWVNNYTGNLIHVKRDTGELLKRTLSSEQQNGNLYTYSDFTGYQLRNFTSPRGTYRRTFTGCAADTYWKSLTWFATTPPNTSVRVHVRTGADQAALDAAPWSAWFTASPTDLEAAGVARSQLLQVEFELQSADKQSSPALQSYDLAFNCQTIFQ